MRSFKKHPKADLKRYYILFLETGLIIVLILFLIAFRMDFTVDKKDLVIGSEQETITLEEVIQTKQPERPPDIPRPVVPVAVPDDEIISDEIINLDAELVLNEALEIPSKPPSESTEEGTAEEEDFFIVVEQMPELIGGFASIQDELTYPTMAKKAGIQGRVIIQFIVNEKGEVEQPEVIRSIGGGCDEEALRIVKTLTFRPGRQRGEPVRVQFSLPVIFKLRES